MTFKTFLSAVATSALIAGAASAQMYNGWDRDAGYDGFNTGMADQGYYDGWDRNDDGMLDESEFATGTYADWDTDNDGQITEDEYTVGSERWYGTDYEGDFTTIDADQSGYIDQSEYGSAWDTSYYSAWDSDGDGLLTDSEYNRGLYDSADLDGDQYISVEEEGWFEGWFDGDDVEAEIREVGDVL
ncbi:MAG: hypothetical protein P1U53_08485 [Sulfitobacter sp.]|nr:hypothetical protein [Sulfitobacter sp.]